MDFVAKALGSLSGLPFALGDQIPEDPKFRQIFKMHNATVRKTGQPCTVFVYDTSSSPATVTAANLAASTLRRLRLPGVLQLIDSAESGGRVYIATEVVQPLNCVLPDLSISARKWLLNDILSTLVTLEKLDTIRASLCAGTVFINAQGQFVLGGFDVDATTAAILPCADYIIPPEGWDDARELQSYQFGVLVDYLLRDQDRLVKTLLGPRRPPIAKLATSSMVKSFQSSPVTKIAESISSVFLLDQTDLEDLLALVQQHSAELPGSFVVGTVVPQLIQTGVKGGIATVKTVLPLIADHYTSDSQLEKPFTQHSDQSVGGWLASLFSSFDREVRLELLEALPRLMPALPAQFVQTKVMPVLGPGFADTDVRLRTASLQSIPILAPKLTERQRNGDVLKIIARTRNDAEADIRALSITTLCALAPHLSSRSAVVATALGTSLKDPSPAVRTAALHGVSLTAASLSAREVAEKLMSPTAIALLDKDPEVSAEAADILDSLVAKIKETAGHPSRASSVAPSKASSLSPPLAPAASSSHSASVASASRVLPPKASVPKSPLDVVGEPLSNGILSHSSFDNTDVDAWDWEEENDAEKHQDENDDAWGWDD